MRQKGSAVNKTESTKIRSATQKELEQRVEYALKHLGDRSVLNKSPLAGLSYVERLSAAQYRGHLLPRGLALHDTLTTCIERVATELSNEPRLAKACTYLKLVANGANYREISNQLGLSREHISRVYRKKAIELVTDQFLFTVNNDK